jgi:hypothetical protein
MKLVQHNNQNQKLNNSSNFFLMMWQYIPQINDTQIVPIWSRILCLWTMQGSFFTTDTVMKKLPAYPFCTGISMCFNSLFAMNSRYCWINIWKQVEMLVKTYNYSKIYSFALSTIDLLSMLQNHSSATQNYCKNANIVCILNNKWKAFINQL